MTQEKTGRCTKCDGKGYYHMMYKAEGGKPEESMMMFCSCKDGLQFRQISVDMRLADMKAFANEVLPRIEKAEKALHTPDEAGKELKSLKDDIQELLKKVEQSTKQM